MSKSTRARQFSRPLVAWMLAAGFGFGVYRVYRWAEPSPASLAAVLSGTPVNNINLQLDGVAFENFANGAKKLVAVGRTHPPGTPPIGGAPNSLQSADIEDIRDGKLFAANQGGRREEEKRRREEGGTQFSVRPASLSAVPATTDNRQPTPTLTQKRRRCWRGDANRDVFPRSMGVISWAARRDCRLNCCSLIRCSGSFA